MDVLALCGWRTCRETPFKNSFSSASLPTRRSRAAMRASYSASTSAAAVSLSSPPASNLATQILIRLRPIPWRLARACSDSPPRNSWTTWRLNSIECVRCLAMGFLLESPVQLADSHLPHLSTPRGALQIDGYDFSFRVCARSHRGRGTSWPDLCWRRPFRLVATAAKNRLTFCLHTMGDDLAPSQWADKHPKLARLFASVTLLVFAAVTLAWWGVLAWLIWRVI